MEFGGSGEDRARRGQVALEDPAQDVGAGAPPLLHTCHYQRKDSPGEALTLSPEPLHHGDRGTITEERPRQKKQGQIKGNTTGRKQKERVNKEKKLEIN